MASVDLKGVKINYRCMGKGEHVILIHGLAANHGFWHLDVLLPLIRQYHVTLFDLRGHGYSSMPAKGYSTAAMAEDLQGLMDHLQISQAHLIGHSYGGTIALHSAALFPERVSSLVLADSRVRSLQPTNRLQDWPNWKEIQRKLEAFGVTIPLEENESGLWLLEQLAQPRNFDFRARLKDSPLFFPFSKWNGGKRTAERWRKLLVSTAARQEFVAADPLTREQLKTIQQPTLALCGENSPAVPSLLAIGKLLHRCQMAVIPGAGHFFPFNNPKPFVHRIKRFLANLGAQDRRLYRRFPLQLNLRLRMKTGTWLQARTIDISRHGLLIQTPQALVIGSEVEIEPLPEQLSSNIALQGKVVRAAPEPKISQNGFGINLFYENDESALWDNYLTS